MFAENCRKCGKQFVHILNLQSYGNYRMCPSLYQSLWSNFITNGTEIYCGPSNGSKAHLPKVKPNHCVYCNQKLVKMAAVVGMKHFEVCSSAFGLFLCAYQTDQRGITTQIFCEPKPEVKAKIAKPYTSDRKTNHS